MRRKASRRASWSEPSPTGGGGATSSTTRESRHKILRKLGLSEDDVRASETLLAQIPPLTAGVPSSSSSTKAEWILGYAERRLRREKALKVLGVSEEELEVENSKALGSLGEGGRRRSFSGITHHGNDDDVMASMSAAADLDLAPPFRAEACSTKAEWLLGFTESRLRREKALKILGVSEEELERMETGESSGSADCVDALRKSKHGLVDGARIKTSQ